jgi:hypothetical protein
MWCDLHAGRDGAGALHFRVGPAKTFWQKSMSEALAKKVEKNPVFSCHLFHVANSGRGIIIYDF